MRIILKIQNIYSYKHLIELLSTDKLESITLNKKIVNFHTTLIDDSLIFGKKFESGFIVRIPVKH